MAVDLCRPSLHKSDYGCHNEETTPKVTRAASAATFHGWKDVDLIVRSSVVEEDDDLNEGFCHYSIIDDE